MSISSEITRISDNVAAAYTAASEVGATMPETQNSDNLAATIRTLSSSGGISMTKLWENASTSNFAKQTISLDLSSYDAVLVYADTPTRTENDMGASAFAMIGHGGTLTTALSGSYYFTCSRRFEAKTTGIVFSNSSQWGWDDGGNVIRAAVSNGYNVPKCIYGIKGVQ